MNWIIKARLLSAALMALHVTAFADPTAPATEETIGTPRSSAESVYEATVTIPAQLQNMLIHAISLIGVKYKFGGSSAQSGFDCSGFVHHVVAESIAIDLPRSSYAMGRVGLAVGKDDLRPGDLVFYNTLHRAYSHVGIYLGEGRFVHAPSRGKSVEIVDMTDSYWKKRFNGARRLVSSE